MSRSSDSSKTEPIIIVGAGIFGLSTAIHLAQRGYKNVTIFDKQPYHETQYSYFKGCDGASADINKIFRCAYGAQTEYMHLSLEARQGWQQWNEELASGGAGGGGGGLPNGMTTKDRVFINNGNLSLTDEKELPNFEYLTVSNMEEAGYPDTQLVTTDAAHLDVAMRKGFEFAMDPFRRGARGKGFLGVLDTTGGTTVADKACRFALHKAQVLGVRTVFGRETGTFVDFARSQGQVDGIRTRDGRLHPASKIILACGGWTPSLVPSLDSVCETTCGSVVMLRIPKTSPLFARYSPENFPTWTWNVRAGVAGGLYGFAVNEEGLLKIGYRGEKYPNPQLQADGRERSVPITRYTEDAQITSIPHRSWQVIKNFIREWMPDLLDEGQGVTVEMSRLCWYNDSWDNHFVVDWVPGHEGRVMVATAGSGHAFKYTPVIGKYVVDVMESKGLDRDLIQKWRWREQPQQKQAGSSKADGVINQLMEGSEGPRCLGKQKMVSEQSLRISDGPRL